MLNSIIRFALRQRLLVVVFSLLLLVAGGWQAARMDIDVFPNLNRPRVVIMTEAHGMAPEEVEALITIPIEAAINGANSVEAVRSSAGVGISVTYVEFDWGTDIHTDRQIVMERLQLVQDRMPEGVKPQLAPISSIMGQIVMIGMWSEGEKTSPLEVRTLADWVVRQRLLTIPGVSQVFTMGGGRMQFQVLVDPDKLLDYGISLHEVKQACQESNQNATGGYLDEQGPNEFLVRALGRVQSVNDLKQVVVTMRDGRPVLLSQIANVIEGPQVKRGDSAAYVRVESPESRDKSKKNPATLDSRLSTLDSRLSTLDSFSGGPAVILTVNKQPEADTREVTNEILKALADLAPSLPDDIRIRPELYSQKAFIDRAIENVVEALRDGGFLVVIILFLFLMNFRTTFITLTAIPMSIAITALVFTAFGLSINTMTLGGLAVAIGELVDDAIVDVENIFRRLRENRHATKPKHPLLVVFQASVEIRNSIVFGTMIVVLVFLPLFALSGMEGLLFAPLGIAYIVSILSSLLVSLTLTPVLSYMLLSNSKLTESEKEGPLLRFLKWAAGGAMHLSLQFPKTILLVAAVGVAIAFATLAGLERDFLPPFNEGVAQLNVILPPGTSLRKSNEVAESVMQRIMKIEGVEAFSRRTGRAELDEHAEGVNVTEMIINFDPDSDRGREEVLDDIRHAMLDIPGIVTTVEQPLAHLISHMVSGVKAQIGIKIFGDDLGILRRKAQEMAAMMRNIDGVTDLLVETAGRNSHSSASNSTRDKLELYGLTPALRQRVHLDRHERRSRLPSLARPTYLRPARSHGRTLPRKPTVARPVVDRPTQAAAPHPFPRSPKSTNRAGPNTINRELVRPSHRHPMQRLGPWAGRRRKRDAGRPKAAHRVAAPRLLRRIRWPSSKVNKTPAASSACLFAVSMLGVMLVLYSMFRSINFALQVMAALPTAFIGSVTALVLTDQTLTVAAMVGFISLGGIASRNGILLLNHYLHLVQHEGETWSKSMLIRAGKERLAPVLMTALTSGIGLVPLAMSAGEPGKEILYPVATVILGGLISSTILEFFARPALFWTFGLGAAHRVVEDSASQVELVEEETH